MRGRGAVSFRVGGGGKKLSHLGKERSLIWDGRGVISTGEWGAVSPEVRLSRLKEANLSQGGLSMGTGII